MTASVDFQLPQDLTIANAHALHEQLEALVDQKDHDRIVLHASAVARADTAGIQLLLAFVNSAREHSIDLDWDKPSATLVNAANVLGMERALGIQ